MKHLVLFVLLFTLTACAQQPTIDATSIESLETSIARVRESVPRNKRDAFQAAWETIAATKMQALVLNGFSQLTQEPQEAQETVNSDDAFLATFKDLHGKTADDIIGMAETIKKEQE